MAKLGDYRRKRRAEATNEPFGEEGLPAGRTGTLSGAYVVHLHDATRRHYDLRLEVSGVLASFAVPRGPTFDPDEKHLAVKTEDHPIEYLEFEDVIPAKQYGAGPMIAWDRGMVEYLEGPAEEEIPRGKLDLRLHGLKLRGRFALVKLAKSDKGDEWLLIKKKDEHADKTRNVLVELPRSILSGLTVEQLEHAAEIGETWVARAFALGARRAPQGDERAWSLTVAGAGTAAGDGWLYDAELEGLRVLACRDGDVVTLRRAGPIGAGGEGGAAERVEAFYPELVRALRALPTRRVALDGHIVAFEPSGHPRLSLLADRVARIAKGDLHRTTTAIPVVLVATDLLLVGDADTRTLPLEVRRELLGNLLPDVGFVRTVPPLDGPREPLLAFCAEHGIEGIVAKKGASLYDGPWVFLPSGISKRPHAPIHHRPAGSSPRRGDGQRDGKGVRSDVRSVPLTNRAKVFWPKDAGGYTKGDLCDYYANVADVLVPHIRDRPLILVRYPDGIEGKNFYQWNVPPGMPPWVRTMSFEGEEGETKRGFLVDDPQTLLYIANLGTIPLHVLACRVADLDSADFFTIDFDVKQSEFRHAITLAKTLRTLLDAIGLRGFPKTSGQSGLHVLVPLGPGQTFDTARALADLLGKLLVARHADIATMERVVSRRGPKVYVDTGQTGRTRAIVAPYSVRAVPFATVSTPLVWEEVDEDLDPRAFTMKTVPARIAERGDPMADLLRIRPEVERAVANLEGIVTS